MNTNEITELATTWCRMWSENPALAHQLMTDDCVQWSADTPGLDTVVGPVQQEAFVAAYRAEHVNIFTPRLCVVDGGIFAYLWDVTLPEGTVKTGVDVNVLQGSRVSENWTFAGPQRREPDPAPGPATDDAHGRGALATSASEWAVAQGYTVHRDPIVDTSTGRVALLRSTTDGAGGVDLLTIRDGAVEPIWSVTGTRAFRY